MKERISSFDYTTNVEKENTRKTKALMKKEIKIYEDSFNLLVQLLDELFPHPGREPRSTIDIAVLPISTKIVMSLKSCFNLTMMGYYHEAVILHRNILESVLLCMLVAEKPRFAEKWVKKRIDPGEVRRELGLDSVADLFGMMSDYVHMNKASIGTFVEIRIEKQETLMIANWIPKFDERMHAPR